MNSLIDKVFVFFFIAIAIIFFVTLVALPTVAAYFLNRWLTQYVLLDDNASQEQKAQFPLREASVQVSEVPGRPGVYRAVSFLRPHFQLDELSVSLRLVAELPQSTKS